MNIVSALGLVVKALTMTTKPRTKKRVGLYARVSTSDQSPTMQVEALREFAERRGLEVVEEYIDAGVSGTKERRPALDKLMDDARKRRLDGVIVYKFDRFARSVRHLVNALHEFEELGVEFVSYTESIDTSSALGRALFAIASALSELERDLIVERSSEGQRRARARGKHVGRPRLELSAERVMSMKKAGASVREIAREVGVNRTVVRRVLAEANAA